MGCGGSSISGVSNAENAVNKGLHAMMTRQYSEAECHFLLAWVLYQKELGISHNCTIGARRKVGDMCMLQNRYEDAEEAYQDVVKSLTTNPNDPRLELLCQMYVQLALTQYALCLLLRDRAYTLVRGKRGAGIVLQQAEENLLACISTVTLREGVHSLLLTSPYMTLTEIYANTKRCHKAVPILQRSLGLQNKHLFSTHPEVVAVRQVLEAFKQKARRERYEIAAMVVQRSWRMARIIRKLGKTVEDVRNRWKTVKKEPSDDAKRSSTISGDPLNTSGSWRESRRITPNSVESLGSPMKSPNLKIPPRTERIQSFDPHLPSLVRPALESDSPLSRALEGRYHQAAGAPLLHHNFTRPDLLYQPVSVPTRDPALGQQELDPLWNHWQTNYSYLSNPVTENTKMWITPEAEAWELEHEEESVSA